MADTVPLMEAHGARHAHGSSIERAITEVTDRVRWNAMVDGVKGSFFTQLWEWGDLRATLGWEPHRLRVGDPAAPDHETALLQLVVRRLPLVGWGVAHAPRGPIGAADAGLARDLATAVARWARGRRIATLVIDPDIPPSSEMARGLSQPPWREAAVVGENRVHVLDLEERVDPWSNVRRKHREWVRKAEKAGVEVKWSDARTPEAEALEAMRQFELVYGELVGRLNLSTHGPAFTRAVWDRFRAGDRAQLGTATLGGVPVAAMLHVTTAEQMVWYAGGQAEAGASVGAGKLLLWRSIQRAQELGFRRYHMWGTATDSLAHYKEGFGAHEERYVGSRSLALQPTADVAIRSAWSVQRAVLALQHRRREGFGLAALRPHGP